jgi:DNA-binding CsgD family transcriptional regulator
MSGLHELHQLSFLRHERLSDLELQLLSMIGQGKAVKQIAEQLHLSTNTIRTFRARILEKIGAKGISELIHYAIAHDLTEQ